VEVHPYFEELARRRGFYSPELMRAIAQTGSIRDFKEIPKDIRRLYVTAHEVSPQWHIKIQAAFQKHTDNAVSKTVNFPPQATPEDVRQVYLMAHDQDLKGVTIYRDGSREDQVLSFGEQKKAQEFQYITPRPRPEETLGVTRLINTGCGKLYVTVNQDDVGFCEVFAQMGKTGGCASSQIESTGRLISLALRSGVKMEAIVKQINGIRCPHSIWQNGRQVLSCPDAISQVLSQVGDTAVPTPTAAMGACPDCGGAVEHEGGCLVCRSCGFSKCN
jgi:ribonucleoside-diphosphate reductase alpha chain